MAAAGLTHSQLAAKLVVEGSLASIAGNVQGKMPIAPIVLSELERADIKLQQGGTTLFYPLPPTGVFFDMHGAQAVVWFTEADYTRGLQTLEAAMKAAFPRTRQLSDEASPQEKDVRVRSFEVDFGNSRLALVNAEYGGARAESKRFIVRIVAQVRKG
ncbi:hypothetical protein [Terricaulis sp.]|jgi:hypothetical protein|uniref:hypothetical protein n=1 Tax=Terricaulis sp. TaxID=2768686 RepID=UPI002AC7548E|nr:hypothetical protein [Terricaulis sp.]MDZ4691223.1 hypothetical protein [Terricaulis sp.]